MARRTDLPTLEELRGLRDVRNSELAARWQNDVFYEIWEAAKQGEDFKDFRVPQHARHLVTSLVAQLRGRGITVEHADDNTSLVVSWA